MDYPYAAINLPTISTASPESVGYDLFPWQQVSSWPSTAWTLANRAIFVPFTLNAPFLVQKLWWANGASVAGNMDCGIYSNDGTKLVSTGSTAQSGTSVVQSVSLGTPLLLMPGVPMYFALAASSTSATVVQNASTTPFFKLMAVAQQASALPLPASATFATVAANSIPLCGITSRTLI